MTKVVLIYRKSLDGEDYITREYTDDDDITKDDSTMEYGRFVWLEDAIDSLAETYKDGEEFVFKLVGFEGRSK